MKKQGCGVILNFGFILWYFVQLDFVIYMMVKVGIEGLMWGLVCDFGGFGICVNCIVLGVV